VHLVKPVQSIPFEAPWLADVSDGALHLSDKQGYDAWLKSSFGNGERVMVIVVPLVVDSPQFHAAAYRYWRNVVLPIIAEEIGEANLDTAHDVIVAQLTGVQPAPRKRRGLRLKRKSTAMDSMTCAELCDLIDRAIVWATLDLKLVVPMADRSWKWKQQHARLAQPA
jgi:hypothetical protein